MKKQFIFSFFIFLFLLFTGFAARGFSQITAPNWTLNDCSGNPHTLYNYLDSQQVVVMEFSMGCASCTNAAFKLMDLKAEYDVSHPGKVKFFFMDYWGNTCADVNATLPAYDFDAGFAGCEAEKDAYYPSIDPMPAVIVAAGNYHTVIFQHHTWLHSDTLAIQQAITQFFNTVGIEPANDPAALVHIYPNPAKDFLTLEWPSAMELQVITIYDMSGRALKTQVVPGGAGGKYLMPVEGFLPGSYIIELRDQAHAFTRKVFMID